MAPPEEPAPPLFHQKPDRYDEALLGPLTDVMYEFAEAQGMTLEWRAYYLPSWHFFWESDGVTRMIQLSIMEEYHPLQLRIYTTAWRDDEKSGERVSSGGGKKAYILFMPVASDTLVKTLEVAQRDAEALTLSGDEGREEGAEARPEPAATCERGGESPSSEPEYEEFGLRPDTDYMYWPELGALTRCLHTFADAHGIAAEKGGVASWVLAWHDDEIRRQIRAVIVQRFRSSSMEICAMAWRDVQGAGGAHFVGMKTGYILFMPLTKGLLIETLETVLRDAMSLTPSPNG